MSKLNRRDFFKASGGILAAGTLASFAAGCGTEQEYSTGQTGSASSQPLFRYAMCNESMQGQSWEQQCETIANAGYKGVEIAAFTLVEQGVQDISPAERRQMLETMQNAGITCAGLHWLLTPPPEGLHFTTADAAVREKTVAYLHELIDFCGDLEGSIMVFGSPNQRGARDVTIEEAKKHFADGLAQVADHARERNVMILIEPLDRSQTDVVNTLAEAVEIVEQIQHPAIQTMFDFHNTPDETEPFDVLIDKYYPYIHHIHVQEMDGRYLGTGNAVNDFVEAFQTLKNKGYDKWVSLEVFDFTPGGETIAGESMKILREIEAKLV